MINATKAVSEPSLHHLCQKAALEEILVLLFLPCSFLCFQQSSKSEHATWKISYRSPGYLMAFTEIWLTLKLYTVFKFLLMKERFMP